MKRAQIHQRDLIVGLQKGLMLMQLFSSARPRLTITQAAGLSGLSHSSARRFFLTLLHDGFLETDGRNYWLTPRTLRLAQAYADSAKLPSIVRPVADHVARVTQEHVSIAVRDENDMVFIARSRYSHVSSGSMRVGARVPIYCTASGRMLLSTFTREQLDRYFAEVKLEQVTPYTKTSIDDLLFEIRRAGAQGYAIVSEEYEIGMRVMGVPLRNRDHRFAGALCITTAASRISEAGMEHQYLSAMYEAQALLRPLLEPDILSWQS